MSRIIISMEISVKDYQLYTEFMRGREVISMPDGDYVVMAVDSSGKVSMEKVLLIDKEKPPIGLLPRKLFNESRVSSIISAMHRYREEGKETPKEWVDELFELRGFI